MTLQLQTQWTCLVLRAQAQGQWRKASMLAIGLNHFRRYAS